MSSIATVHVLPVDRLPELRAAIALKKRLFRAPLDMYSAVLSDLGRELPAFPLSGYVLAVALPFLDEQQVPLMTAPAFDDLARAIQDARGTTAFFLTSEHRDRYLARLQPGTFDSTRLRTYYEDFNACQEPEAGQWMLAAIDYLVSTLRAIQPGEVALLQVQ